MTDIANILLNNGVAIAVIAFFMYKDIQFSKTLNKTLTSLQESVDLIKNYFITGEEKKTDDLR